MDNAPQISAPPAAQRARVQWIDYARGICIFLVVFAHVWWAICDTGFMKTNAGIEWFFDTAAVTAMPFFFFVSGMFISGTLAKPPKAFLIDRFRGLGYPYAVWALLHGVLLLAAGQNNNNTDHLSALWTLAFYPRWHYWFLYVMLFVQVVHYALHRLGVGPKAFLAIALVFFATKNVPGVSFDFWDVLYQVRHHIAYYAIGVFMGSKGPINRLNDWPTHWLVGAMIAGFAFDAWCVAEYGERIAAANLAMAGLGIISLASATILLARTGRLTFISAWGNRSLEIYTAHVIALAGTRVILFKIGGIESVPVHIVLGTLAGLYVPMGLYWASKRVGFPYLFSLKAL